MGKKRKDEIIEKIFLAISEDLVSKLIEKLGEKNISLHKIIIKEKHSNKRQLIRKKIKNTLTGKSTKTFVSVPFKITYGDDFNAQLTGDSEHKLDVVIKKTIEEERNRVNYFAIEVKAGQSGPVESASKFFKHCKEKPFVIRNSNTFKGRMSSILGRIQVRDNEYKIHSELNVNREILTREIKKKWYLCLRKNDFWEQASISTAECESLKNFFENCRIFYLDELARKVGEKNFNYVLNKILPEIRCPGFQTAMWNRAIGNA